MERCDPAEDGSHRRRTCYASDETLHGLGRRDVRCDLMAPEQLPKNVLQDVAGLDNDPRVHPPDAETATRQSRHEQQTSTRPTTRRVNRRTWPVGPSNAPPRFRSPPPAPQYG